MRLSSRIKIVISSLLFICSIEASASCYIMGDSIAQGVAQHIKNCSSATKVGLNTDSALRFWGRQADLKKELKKDFIVVSLGVNDGNSENSIKTLENLVGIRSQMQASRIVWILPPKHEKSQVVQRIANHYNDYVLDIRSVLGKDGIHPTGRGYLDIANKIKEFQ